MLLQNGTYACKTCLPPYSVKADGAFHPVRDRPYWDEIAIDSADPRTVVFKMRAAGKLVAENKRVVSADGKSLTITGTTTANGAGATVTQSTTQTRVGAPIAGAHLISGRWKTDPKTTTASDNALTIALKITGDKLHLQSGIGESLDATLGGDYALNVGDPGKTMTKAALLAPNRLRLTDQRDGKVVQVTDYAVAADGRTLNASWSDPRDGSKGTFVATKQ